MLTLQYLVPQQGGLGQVVGLREFPPIESLNNIEMRVRTVDCGAFALRPLRRCALERDVVARQPLVVDEPVPLVGGAAVRKKRISRGLQVGVAAVDARLCSKYPCALTVGRHERYDLIVV